MGIYSTLRITRTKVLSILVEYLSGGVDDEALESFMCTVLEERLYNCRIVPDDCVDNDDELI